MSTPSDSTFVPSYQTYSETTLYGSWFSKPGNMIFPIAFLLCLLYHLYILVRHRNYSVALFRGIGTLFEIIGYIDRCKLPLNPWNIDAFKLQLTMLILGPSLIAAALSISLKHMVIHYGAEASILKPRLYPWILLGLDVVSIAIQVVGAAVSSSDDPETKDTATTILTLGVALQAANMLFCGGLMVLYWVRLRKDGGTQLCAGDALTKGKDQRLEFSIYGSVVAYVIVRCIYRPELAGVWDGEVMQDESTLLILDGA